MFAFVWPGISIALFFLAMWSLFKLDDATTELRNIKASLDYQAEVCDEQRSLKWNLHYKHENLKEKHEILKAAIWDCLKHSEDDE